MNWMKYLDDTTVIKRVITIPCSQSSCIIKPYHCYDYLWWKKKQTLSISEQLAIGIRGFDLNVIYEKDTFFIGENKMLSQKSLCSFLEDVCFFLENQSSEFIFLFLSKTQSWDNTILLNFWKSFDEKYMVKSNQSILQTQIKQLRKKIIPVLIDMNLLKNKPSSFGYIKNSEIHTQYLTPQYSDVLKSFRFNTYKRTIVKNASLTEDCNGFVCLEHVNKNIVEKLIQN